MEINTFKNKRGANIEFAECRRNTFNYYCGCTIDIKFNVYSDDFRMKYSFWLMDHDTGWDGEDIMDGFYEEELECNEDFNEDMELGDVYSDEELEEMAWNLIMDNYEFQSEDCPFLDYVNRIEDALKIKATEQFENGGNVEDPDIDSLLGDRPESFWDELEEEDIIDYDSMIKENKVHVPGNYGTQDYSSLVEDFEEVTINVKGAEDNEHIQQEETLKNVPDSALDYCNSYPAYCLLLPFAICKGMLNTYFVQPRGLLQQVCKLLNGADWNDTNSAEFALRTVRTLTLSELKKSRWVDIDNCNFRRYKRYEDIVDEIREELDSLCQILETLCPKNAHNLQNVNPFVFSPDRSKDILQLRKEFNLVIPEKLAYDFLVDSCLREKYSKEKLEGEDDYGEYKESRFSLVRDDVFSIIEREYLVDESLQGFFDAALTLNEYEGETFVKQILESEDEDDWHFEMEDSGGLVSHGICYLCSDYVSHYTGHKWVVENPGFMYVNKNEKIAYRGYVPIPSTVMFHGKQYPVDKILSEAFQDCTGVKEVDMDEGVTEIESKAFSGCTKLCKISLPNSLNVLGSACFEDCTSLRSVYIPEGVIEVDASCFEGCNQLAEIVVDEKNQVYKSVDGVLCDKRSGDVLFSPNAHKAIDEDSPKSQGEVIEEENGIFLVDGIRYEIFESSDYTSSGEWKYIKSLRVLPLKDNVKYSGKITIPTKIKYHRRWREVTEIENDAFKDCPELLEVSVPASVTRMTLDVTGSPRLASINVDEANDKFVSIDGVVYDKKVEKIISYPHGHGISFEIPLTVTSIGEEFNNCTILQSIVIPESVTNLQRWGRGVFTGCTGLQSVSLPGSIKCISTDCFNDCSSLKSVTFGEGVESLESAFCNCTSLREIVFPDSLKSVEFSAFAKCGMIESVRFPDGRYFNINSIPKRLLPWGRKPFVKDGIYYVPYFDYNDLTALIGVKDLPEELMDQFIDPEVKTLKIPSVVEQYGYKYRVKVFRSDCAQFPNLQRLELPETLHDFNKYNRCHELTEFFVAPSNPIFATLDGILYSKDLHKLIAVPMNMSIDEFTVREGVEVIGERAFYGMDGLKGLTLANSVREIESGAFEQCTSLRQVHFNEGLEVIKSVAFSNTPLTSVVLPASIKDIGQRPFSGYRPFRGCRNLKEFALAAESELFTVIDGVLYQKMNDGLKLVYCPSGFTGELIIPDGVISIGDSALWATEGLETVEMPDSVEAIAGWAFAECKSLQKVKLSKNLKRVGSCAFRECTTLKELDFTVCKYYFGWDGIDSDAFHKNPQLKLLLPENIEERRVYFERAMNEK